MKKFLLNQFKLTLILAPLVILLVSGSWFLQLIGVVYFFFITAIAFADGKEYDVEE